MSGSVLALRGATTIDDDTVEQITDRVQALVTAMMERNDLDRQNIISVIFTATEDISAMFPAAAARSAGLGDVPLLCARELSIAGGTKLCIRAMMHVNTDRSRDEIRHVYLEKAVGLRDDLPG